MQYICFIAIVLHFFFMTDSDLVLWSDEDVCILHPNAKDKGVVIYRIFSREKFPRVDTPIYFRAIGHLERHSLQALPPSSKDVNANYYFPLNSINHNFCIRIDPSKTFVYSSECRLHFFGTDKWKSSRISLTDFVGIIKENRLYTQQHKGNWLYNLVTHRLRLYPSIYNEPLTIKPPEYNSEIIVRTKIPPEWRVLLVE
jgi:hypothetical protein